MYCEETRESFVHLFPFCFLVLVIERTASCANKLVPNQWATSLTYSLLLLLYKKFQAVLTKLCRLALYSVLARSGPELVIFLPRLNTQPSVLWLFPVWTLEIYISGYHFAFAIQLVGTCLICSVLLKRFVCVWK